MLSVTIDDFEWDTLPHYLTAEQRNERLLMALSRHRLQTIIFVNGQYVDEGKGPSLLHSWDREGHGIGNHTYSHNDFNDGKISLSVFAEDIWQNEEYLRPCRHFLRLFRFPFLHEGNTQQKRDGLRQRLAAHRYRSAPVTITTCDWAIDDRLRHRLASNPRLDLAPYRDFYLKHVQERVAFFTALGKKITDKPIPHVLLIHYTLLNSLFLGDLLDALTKQGQHLVDAVEAFDDPFLRLQPAVFPSDGSLLWSLACAWHRAQGVVIPDDTGQETITQMNRHGL